MALGYESWVLRYVPDPVRGEFVNVGVIVGVDGRDWAIRSMVSFSRANRLGGNASLLRPALNSLRTRVSLTNRRIPSSFQGFQEMARERPLTESAVAELSARYNNALQISPPMPAFGESAEQVAGMLYSHLVLESIREPVSRPRTRMINDFSKALARAWRGENEVPLLRNPVVRIGRQRQNFDFALHDNEVEQMTHVISVNRKDLMQVEQEINAWNFAVRLIRDNGGQLETHENKLSFVVPPGTPITMVHDEPKGEPEREVLAIAKESWINLDVHDVTPANIEAEAARVLSRVH